ncbi:probable Bax inhibitor 1 [Macrobrachium nipponense]|uniref:probable Bax inhibitor 1 n=1 Tax=Macrobrachium nipponense TaxID=159736 RepID=UPI0030C82C33
MIPSRGDISSPIIRNHLKNVYATFTLTTIFAAMGGYISLLKVIREGIISYIIHFSLLLWLIMIPHYSNNMKNQLTRLALLNAAAFFSGINLESILDKSISIDPALIPQVFLSTSIIFISFSLSTQNIIKKVKKGDKDYITHSVDLFLDFILIFKKLLIILIIKGDKRKKINKYVFQFLFYMEKLLSYLVPMTHQFPHKV